MKLYHTISELDLPLSPEKYLQIKSEKEDLILSLYGQIEFWKNSAVIYKPKKLRPLLAEDVKPGAVIWSDESWLVVDTDLLELNHFYARKLDGDYTLTLSIEDSFLIEERYES